MSNSPPPFEEDSEPGRNTEDTLSAADLEVIRAFEAQDSWETGETAASVDTQLTDRASIETENLEGNSDNMLIVFATEVEEDIETMHYALQRVEHSGVVEPVRLLPLQRAGHKLRGSAGAMECHAMATIAQHIEDIAQRVIQGQAIAAAAIPVLMQAILALQTTLVHFVETGQESSTPLQELEEEIQRRALDVNDEDEGGAINLAAEEGAINLAPTASSAWAQLLAPSQQENLPVRIDVHSFDTQPFPSGEAMVRVDARRVAQLMRHSEQLAELRTPLESAQAQTNAALQELHYAQQRLQRIESQLVTLLTYTEAPSTSSSAVQPASSLISRILDEASPGVNGGYARKGKYETSLTTSGETSPAQQWDELEMEHYTERDDLVRAFSEAVADVGIAAKHVRTTSAQLNTLLQKCIEQTAITRNDTFLLHSVPLRVLLPSLESVIHMSVTGQEQTLQFEVSGEATEIDQDIIEALSTPLLQFVSTCITDVFTQQSPGEQRTPPRVWLHAQSVSNEVILEIGFSMMVQGGALDAIRETIDRLNGSITLQRNTSGGVSFHLRLPRSQDAVRCLLVRVGNQQLIVPFSQVHRIEDGRCISVDTLYSLGTLLDFSSDTALLSGQSSRQKMTPSVQPMIIPLQESVQKTVGIVVDEVLDECEVIVKPMVSFMQRPGITGTAIDGKGNVLLLLDLPSLISHYTTQQRSQNPLTFEQKSSHSQAQQHKPTILIADDSTSIRQSLQRVLSQRNYTLYEARDGLEALEQLMEHPPDVFLLDMEMPNLNGYDLLSIMNLYPELANVKVVVLTSRSSDKHRQRALNMGAQAYLTKPWPQDTLLETVERLLNYKIE